MARNTSTNKEKTSAQKASGNLSKSGTRKSADVYKRQAWVRLAEDGKSYELVKETDTEPGNRLRVAFDIRSARGTRCV